MPRLGQKFPLSRLYANSIYFGTQTGNAHMLADELLHDMEELSLKTEIYDLANYQESIQKDIQQKNNLLFVTACYGEGEPTDNVSK
jgi:sulfite reductase alpha subunit-like flavoprotein